MALNWAGNKRRYLLALPAIAGMLIIWEAFILVMDPYNPMDEGFQGFTYYWGLAIVGCFYASSVFAEFGNQAQGIAWLAVPASALEKLLCGLFYAVVLCILFYSLVFFVTDIPMVEIGNQMIRRQHRMWPGGYPISPSPIFSVFKGLPGDPMDSQLHIILFMYFAMQSVFLLGSVYFKRFAFIKTVVAVMIFILVFTMYERIRLDMMPNQWHVYPPVENWMKDGGTIRVQSIRISEWLTTPLAFLLLFGIPPVFWIATYFRIKEKEV